MSYTVFEGYPFAWLFLLMWLCFFALFLIGTAIQFERKNMLSGGLCYSFLLAFFLEMFGFPLTIFVLSAFLGTEISYQHENLLIFLTQPLEGGLQYNSVWMGVFYTLAFLSQIFIILAIVLVYFGWRQIYKSQGKLVTDGLYAYMRHPQYIGFVLLIVGFVFMHPTLVTLPMAIVLIVMYVWLAKREERELIGIFGDEYVRYQSSVSMIPRLRVKSSLKFFPMKKHELLLLIGLCYPFIVQVPHQFVWLLVIPYGMRIWYAFKPYWIAFYTPIPNFPLHNFIAIALITIALIIGKMEKRGRLRDE